MSDNIVVVLGTGRSGTSMMMQILHGLGLTVSANLIDASVSNPEGSYEDSEIFKLQADLIKELNSSVMMPMPDNWLNEKATIRAIDALVALIQARIENAPGIFGFKDPKTSMLLPLWVRVFNKLKITPRFVLMVREPASTIASYLRQYSQNADAAELIWLVRMVEALDNTGADCFISHYEDWFDGADSLALELLSYTGLDQYFTDNISDVLMGIIKRNLNRAVNNYYMVKNPYVVSLYDKLKHCSGADYDRDALMAEVRSCRQAIEGFKGWYQSALQSNKRLADMQVRYEKLTGEMENMKSLERKVVELEMQISRQNLLHAQLGILQRQFDQLITLTTGRPDPD